MLMYKLTNQGIIWCIQHGNGIFNDLFPLFFCSGGKPMRIFCSGRPLTLFSQRQKLDRPAPNSFRFFDTMKIAGPPMIAKLRSLSSGAGCLIH
jgi:hypothetical protein